MPYQESETVELKNVVVDVIHLLKVSRSTASRMIKKLVDNKLLQQNGKARNTKYTTAP